MKVILADGEGEHFIRAFQEYDSFGSFFDWVHVSSNFTEIEPKTKKTRTKSYYLPAKVLLLYKIPGESEPFALVWKANQASENDRRSETNISARWSMRIDRRTGVPQLESVPISTIESCIKVYQRWTERHGDPPLPDPAKQPHNIEPERGPSVFIDEIYSRFSWAYNFSIINKNL